MSENIQLDACRLCGGKPVYRRERNDTRPKILCWYQCEKCGAHDYAVGTRKKAAWMWNLEQRRQSAFPLTSRPA